MSAVVTCKTEEDPFKNEGARVFIKDLPFSVYADFYDAQGQFNQQSGVFRRSRAANSEVSDGILPKFKFIRAFIVGLVLARMETIHPKMKLLEWSQHFCHYKSMGFFQTLKGS